MKPCILSIILVIFVISCTEDLSVTPDIQNRNLDSNALSEVSVSPTGQFVWTAIPNYNDADGAQCPEYNNITQEKSFCKVVTISDDIYVFAGSTYNVPRKLNKTTKQWETFSQAVGNAMRIALLRGKYLFSYGNKMYTGLWNEDDDGWYPGIVRSVNQVTGVTTEVAPFPGLNALDFASFAIGTKGYVMGGYTIDTEVMSQEFWEYDFIANTWTNKGTIPGGVRAGASVFVVGNFVYLGLGYSSLDNDYNHDNHRVYRRDWIKFDPANPTAITTLQSFPGTRRRNAKGFVLNDKIYLGWGYGRIVAGTMEDVDDFWEYNPETNAWREKVKCPGNIEVVGNRAPFVQGNAGYVVIGCFSRFWRYSATSAVPVPPGDGPIVQPSNP